MKIKLLFTSFLLITLSSISYGQCAMCRAVAETAGDGKEGFFEGLNNGILYLMAAPYILLTFGAVFLYLSRKKSSKLSCHGLNSVC